MVTTRSLWPNIRTKCTARTGAVFLLFALLLAFGALYAVTESMLLCMVLTLVFPLTLWLIKRPDTLFVFWLVASPLLKEYFVISRPGFPLITFDRLVLLALAGRMVVSVLAARHREQGESGRPRMALVLLVTYLGAEAIGYSRGVWPLTHALQFYLDRVVLAALVFLLARWLYLREGRTFANRVFWAIFWVGITSVVLELLRRFAGFETLLYPNGREFTWEDVVGSRAVGNFYNPMVFGSVLILSLCMIFYANWSQTGQKLKWLTLPPMLIMIALTYSRGVWLSLAIALLIVAWLGSSRLPKLVVLGVSVVAVLVLTPVVFPNVWAGLAARMTDTNTVLGRQDLGTENLRLLAAKPLTGWGAGSFDDTHLFRVRDRWTGSVYFRGAVAHNSFLLMLSDRGLLAFIPYCAFFAFIVYRSWRVYRLGGRWERQVVRMVWVATAVFVVQANTIQVDFFPYLLSIFWLLWGLVIGISEQQGLASVADSSYNA
jgi:O-antigen ligase